jgi:protein phosphatase
MVADGMGGAAAGELASQMATEVVLGELKTRWVEGTRRDPEAFAGAIRIAAESANAHIHEYASKHPENRGMGSTATIAGLLGDTLYIAQIGDSRGYLVRDGVARQITKDQSLVQRLVEAGDMTPEEAELSERKNIILQALGPEPTVKIDLTHQPVRRGDVLVLCSDGLSGQVTTDSIGRAVATEPDLVAVCKQLIDLANEAGGPDNITVVAVRFDGDGLAVAAGADDVGHRVFHLTSESRATIPVPVQPDEDDVAASMAITAETPTQSVEAILPAPAPRGLSVGTLRVVFAFIGLAVIGYFVWMQFR